jgi:hypothetical protein
MVGNPQASHDHLSTFFLPLHFLFPFSAQKAHVKPPNDLTHYHTTTSAWHVSYIQPVILDIDQNKRNPDAMAPGLAR